jgi:hypothetical protein
MFKLVIAFAIIHSIYASNVTYSLPELVNPVLRFGQKLNYKGVPLKLYNISNDGTGLIATNAKNQLVEIPSNSVVLWGNKGKIISEIYELKLNGGYSLKLKAGVEIYLRVSEKVFIKLIDNEEQFTLNNLRQLMKANFRDLFVFDKHYLHEMYSIHDSSITWGRYDGQHRVLAVNPFTLERIITKEKNWKDALKPEKYLEIDMAFKYEHAIGENDFSGPKTIKSHHYFAYYVGQTLNNSSLTKHPFKIIHITFDEKGQRSITLKDQINNQIFKFDAEEPRSFLCSIEMFKFLSENITTREY